MSEASELGAEGVAAELEEPEPALEPESEFALEPEADPEPAG